MLKYFLPTLLLFSSTALQANDILENSEIAEEDSSGDDIYVIDIDHIKAFYMEDVGSENGIGGNVLLEEADEISAEDLLAALEDAITSKDRTKIFFKLDPSLELFHLRKVDTINVYTNGKYKEFDLNERQDVSLDYVDQDYPRANYKQLFLATTELIASGVITLVTVRKKIAHYELQGIRPGTRATLALGNSPSRLPKLIPLKFGFGVYLALDGMSRYRYITVDGDGEEENPISAVYASGKNLYDLMTN